MSEERYPIERAQDLAVYLPDPVAGATHVIVDEEYNAVLTYTVLSKDDVKTGQHFDIYQLASVYKPVHYAKAVEVPTAPGKPRDQR
jgi:hypothetical protein